MIAEAGIRTDVTVQALTLPGEAVVHDPQGATIVYVYFTRTANACTRGAWKRDGQRPRQSRSEVRPFRR